MYTDSIFSKKSIELSGIWMHIFFWGFVLVLFRYTGLYTILILLSLYVLALVIKKHQTDKPRLKISCKNFYKNVKPGDTIIVCRSGDSGVSSDLAELFMYFVFGTIYSGSIMGHVGQVFLDYDGVLKVVDVRHNLLHKSSDKHFICTVEEFINVQYEGVKFWNPLKKPLNDSEVKNLTDVVHYVSNNTGHCIDCFNPFRILETPDQSSSFDDIISFGIRHGFGCAENIGFIQRIAGIKEAPKSRFIMPHSFENELILKIIC
jgi:hypothetical protein